ncbi:hypothetical protein FAEPRAA2165_02155 [Faecalibacterium duncaniae]|uniref:Uncharacterized protein n=1 Tax=Faecalibacterium duncaniae (strain DSM 17677 / JCM 31915 / A2-165) TaxID=411483 RepID=C7H772_FAED2|nr:hypothetical protein FAEPRAA2165_02155 [Faecalibacterium duncaniae]
MRLCQLPRRGSPWHCAGLFLVILTFIIEVIEIIALHCHQSMTINDNQ